MEKTYQILKILIWVLVFAVIIAGATVLYNNLSGQMDLDNLAAETTGDEEPTLAPDFTFYDSEGNSLSLSDFRGKPVVLNFWASWCGPCKSEMPEFQAAFEEYGEDIHFVMMNLTDGSRETVDTAKKFLEGANYTFPVYFDSDMAGAYAYGVNAVPVTYFIDAQGNFVAWARAALSAETLQKGIDMLLK